MTDFNQDWKTYTQTELTLRNYIGNLFTHTDMFEELLAEQPKRILEVGLGTGSMSTFLSHLGYAVTGLDNVPEILKYAAHNNQAYGGRRITFVLGDAFAMPFKDNEFDVAFHQGFFEHFSDHDIQALLDEQLRVAKAVVMSVPGKHYGKLDYGNERLMTKAEWEEILANYQVATSKEYLHVKKNRLTREVLPTMYLAKITR